MPTSTMNDLFNTLRDMMTQHAALFEGTGLTLFKAFATILLVWFGIQNALASASGGPAFRFDKFASLLMTVAFGFAMMSFYSQPIPGFGISFYHLIVDEGLNLANQLNHALVDEIWKRLTSLYWGMETPGLSLAINVMEAIRYAITLICILIAQGSVFSVIAFGYVACAVAVMVGPIFVPFFIVPDLQWLFWGWFKAYSVRVLSSYRERLFVCVRESDHPLCGCQSASVRRRKTSAAFLPHGHTATRF